jgi:hypothetical protein
MSDDEAPYSALGAPAGAELFDIAEDELVDAPLLGWNTAAPARGRTTAGAEAHHGGAGGAVRELLSRLNRMPTHEALLSLIVALLALVVVLLGVDVRGAAHDGAGSPRLPAPPAAPGWPAPPPSAAPGSPASRAAWEAHLAGAGYERAASSFVTLWWQRQRGGALLLEVPDAALHALVLVNAEVSAADGRDYLLRQPLGEAFFTLQRAPDGASLDVVVPPLAAARVSPRSTIAPAAASGGLYAGWAASLPRYDAGGTLGTAAAAPGDGASSTSAFYLASDFLLSRFALADVLGALDAPALASARLAAARGHPRNLELELQGLANGTGVGVHLSVAAAPEVPMPPRRACPRARRCLPSLTRHPSAVADERAGYFSTCFAQLGAEPGAGPQQPRATQDARACVAHRWRLTKAASSPAGCGPPPAPPCVATSPITYHLDASIPDKWAQCFAHGVTSWDAAFAAAGWARGTVRALRPGDAGWPSDYAAEDIRYSGITFAPSLDAVYAVGPSTVDPRSGEILNADIMFAHSWVAWLLAEWHGLAHADEGGQHAHGGYERVHRAPRPSSQCFHHHGPEEAGGSGAGALLRAAGDLPRGAASGPASDAPVVPFATVPAASSDAFVCEALSDVVAHEVGHTLGLRHNFAASAAWSAEQLADPAHVAHKGTAASVMDYLPPSMPANRSAQSYYFGPVVGPYDTWAISIAYAPSAAEDAAAAAAASAPPADVAQGLPIPPAMPAESAALLARAAERELAFCTDDDAPGSMGTDAACSTYDLTSSPVAYFRDRVALARAAVARAVASAVSAPGERGDYADAYTLARAVLHTSSVSVASAGRYAAKFLGAASVSRARWGQLPVNVAPVVPAPPAAQRDALSLLTELLVGDSLYVPASQADDMTVRGSRSGDASGGVWYDPDALGRLPAPLVADARRAKAAILASALAPARGEAMARAAWAARASGAEPPVDAAEVVDTLTQAAWGEAAVAAMRAGVPGDDGGCASQEALVAAVAQLRDDDAERRALQLMLMAALRDAAQGAAQPGDTKAAAQAALMEARAGVACLLRAAPDRRLRMHLLAAQEA